MKQETLDKMCIGEKIADIQEYFFGTNGHITTYEVTIYECVQDSFLFFKKRKINKITFPFYFSTKSVAEDFLEHYDLFEIVEYIYIGKKFLKLCLKSKSTKKDYYMVDAYTPISYAIGECTYLRPNGIWGGKVNFTADIRIYMKDNIDYKKIFDIEKLASKEGTHGESFTYKLCKI